MNGDGPLELEGMTCAACAARIDRSLNKLEGVEASVNFATEKAAVRYDDDLVALDDLVLAVASAGYGASLTRSEGEPATASDCGSWWPRGSPFPSL